MRRRRFRTLSAEPHFDDDQEDSIRKFMDCLARLPNLKVLEIFPSGGDYYIGKELKRKSTHFTSIRELRVDSSIMKFIQNCPNVESITITEVVIKMKKLISYGKELKKVKRYARVYACDIRHSKLRVTFCSGQKCLLTDGAIKLRRPSQIFRRSALQRRLGALTYRRQVPHQEFQTDTLTAFA